jgi:hypothetical protein
MSVEKCSQENCRRGGSFISCKAIIIGETEDEWNWLIEGLSN